MKNLLRGLFLASVIGVLIVNVVVAAPHITTITIPAAQALSSPAPRGDTCIISNSFFIPRGTRSAYLAVAFTDTSTGPTTTSDSIQIALQKGTVISGALAPDSIWDNVVEMNPLSMNKTNRSLSMQRWLSPDSTHVGAFALGGMHRWIVYGGQGTGGQVNFADTTAVAYIIKCAIELDGFE